MPYRVIEVLVCGQHRLPDGRVVKFDRERIARICKQANAQKSARIRVPMAWMHDPRAVPLELSQQDKQDLHPEAWLAKGFFGEAVKYAQDSATGNLLAKVFIPDEADARQFDKVGQVSPSLWQGWTDERNVYWPELTIAHIAATPKPVQRDVRGKPEYPANLLLSQPARAAAAFQLSFPATPRSTQMADEYEDDTDTMETEGGVSLTPEQIEKIVSMCAKHGLKLAGDIKDASGLLIAMESASNTLSGEDGDMDMDDDMEEGEDEMGVKTEETDPPMFMSHPVVRERFDKLAAYERKERAERLRKLFDTKKVNKAVHDKLSKQLSAINMSQSGVCDFSALDSQLDLLEELTPVTPLSKKPINLGHDVKEVPNPNDKAGPHKTQEQLDAIRRERAKTLGIPLKQ